MMRAVRSFLAARWTLLGMGGAVLSLVVAVVALAGVRDVALAGLSVLVGIALVAMVMVGLIARSTEHRTRAIERRLDAVHRQARVTTTKIQAVRAAQQEPANGALRAILDTQRRDILTRFDGLAERHDELRAELTARIRTTDEQVASGFQHAGVAAEAQLSELSALANLYTMFSPDDEVPVLGGYAASPQTILRLVSTVQHGAERRLIVECGSGASTVWLAFACRRAGRGRIVALEHEDHYAEQTRAALARHGLADYAEVRSAALEPVTIADQTYHWYTRTAWEDLEAVDMLFVDGPPGSVGPRSRYPAFPLLAPALADGALVALDDVHRENEAVIGTEWSAEDVAGVQLTDETTLGRTRFFTARRAELS